MLLYELIDSLPKEYNENIGKQIVINNKMTFGKQVLNRWVVKSCNSIDLLKLYDIEIISLIYKMNNTISKFDKINDNNSKQHNVCGKIASNITFKFYGDSNSTNPSKYGLNYIIFTNKDLNEIEVGCSLSKSDLPSAWKDSNNRDKLVSIYNEFNFIKSIIDIRIQLLLSKIIEPEVPISEEFGVIEPNGNHHIEPEIDDIFNVKIKDKVVKVKCVRYDNGNIDERCIKCCLHHFGCSAITCSSSCRKDQTPVIIKRVTKGLK